MFYKAISNGISLKKKHLILFLKNGAVPLFGLITVQNAKRRLCSLASWMPLLEYHQEGGGAVLGIPVKKRILT